MDNLKFIGLAIKEVVNEYNQSHATQITEDDVFVVWSCKTLQNNKALLSTNVQGDGAYYELTYNGDKNQMYLDAYIKRLNLCIEVE